VPQVVRAVAAPQPRSAVHDDDCRQLGAKYIGLAKTRLQHISTVAALPATHFASSIF
jgi:hypothetical protein